MEQTANFYDVVVIGGGPAGLTAALYLARARYRVVVVEKDHFGGQITITSEVVNYPGVGRTSGTELTETMRKQAEGFGAEFLLAEVTGLELSGDIKTVRTGRGDLRCFGVLLATGAHPRMVGFQGEEQFRGRGVAYCATCDGEFFTGKDVFVVGGGFAAAEESVFLTKYARQVTILIRGDDFTCAQATADAARSHEKITVLTNTEVEEVSGDTSLRYLRYRNTKTGQVTKHHAADGETFGVFVFAGYEPATELVRGLAAEDTVLFLLSGGGSALFEKPLLPGTELQDITGQLLASGADIVEMNTIRKRLSGVKGGRFAQRCAPAQVFSIVLSDILGDPLDMIASGPAVPDTSTCAQALAIAEKYHLKLSEQAKVLLAQETPKMLDNVTTQITGSVRELCTAAAAACRELGYEPILLTDQLCCEAREAGSFLGSIVRTHAGQGKKLAYIAGGETVVHLTGKGLGGRNQELALAAAPALAGRNAAVFSVGSDGTDGPTDAAGGYVDGDTLSALTAKGWNVFDTLQNNDAYHALKAVDGLIMTGATGTNVNDVAVALVGEK